MDESVAPSDRATRQPHAGDAAAPPPAELLAAIIASSEDAIASKTLQGIVTSWNAAAERLFGHSASEMIGQSILKIIPPELHQEEDRILGELRQGRRIERYETVRVRKDGRRVHVSLTVSPIRDSSGRVIGAAKIAHDITALRVFATERDQLLEAERTLVELHGGAVRAKSLGKDQGATFTVALPLFHLRAWDERAPATTSDPLQEIALPRLDGAEILLVDDDIDGCEMVSTILGRRGARVHCVASGREALRILEAKRFDLVLSDIGMPDMDGYELIRELRKREGERSRWTPAIAITAYAGSEDRQRSLLSGYQMHMAKPIEAPELIAAIASLKQSTRSE